jgi:hypothetical protein
MVSISTLGEAMSSTSAKRMGSNIFSADRMPALSSTTRILDLSLLMAAKLPKKNYRKNIIFIITPSATRPWGWSWRFSPA